MRQILDPIVALFRKHFSDTSNTRFFFAPGRVNLIGEHIDYNGGLVLPFALSVGTYAVARKNNLGKIRLASVNFDTYVEANPEQLQFIKDDDWANYPKGVVESYRNASCFSGGFDMVVGGNIPNGAGLSSSASIEILTAVVISSLFEFKCSALEMIQLCQKAENEFIKVNCGIMDQFAIGMGKKDHLILIDCNTLAFEHIPCRLGSYKMIIVNTNKKRGLSDSKYNERRSECEAALSILQKHSSIKQLCDLSGEQFRELSGHISDPVLLKRARHVVSENERVKKTAHLLKQNADLAEVGRLMNESHLSLSTDYEVSGKELDTLVAEIRKIDGVAGARMTGAGFGGCAVALVQKNCVPELTKTVTSTYTEIIGYPPEFYEIAIGDGPGEITYS